MLQLICHLFGDYILQSHWMAQGKRKSTFICLTHAMLYILPFLLLTGKAPNPVLAGLTILLSHFFIDRFGLATYVVWAKNWIAPVGSVPDEWDGQEQRTIPRRSWPWKHCEETFGFPPNTPFWLASTLLIVVDNTLHLACNYIALRWL